MNERSRRILAVGASAVCVLLLQQSLARGGEDDVRSKIAGVWRGSSVCLDKSSPCRDEVNVYRFSAIPGHPDEFSATASKVVEDKEIVMGSGHWKYEPEEHALVSQRPSIRLVIRGDQMEGDLSLPAEAGGKPYRHILLKKAS